LREIDPTGFKNLLGLCRFSTHPRPDKSGHPLSCKKGEVQLAERGELNHSIRLCEE